MKIDTLEILRLINELHGRNIAVAMSEKFGISRQAASSRLARLKSSGVIASRGNGKSLRYVILNQVSVKEKYPIAQLEEDNVWRSQCLPIVKDLPPNLVNIWQYGVTEMVNNAIDHSEAPEVEVTICRNLLYTICTVSDNGVGIFAKIQKAMNLYDKREAILELAKGKFTTDPANHSGEGIFFSSRMFDRFTIESDEITFVHLDNNGPDVMLIDEPINTGTKVNMLLYNDSTHTSTEIFDKFSTPEEYTFAKTIVPVKLAQHEGESLVSRSQAKRLTRRFERFKIVFLDFAGVETIGQAFADEIFRVFAASHPDIQMIPQNMTSAVRSMISRAEHQM